MGQTLLKDEEKIMDSMKKIKYGWVDKNGEKISETNNDFSDNYRLQSPNQLIKSQTGVCWDQVELERFYFIKNNLICKTYFIVHYDNDKCPTHTFLTFYKNNKFYWFEHSWEKFSGIHEYASLNELLLDVRNKFVKYELNEKYSDTNLFLIEYVQPKYSITAQEFCKHCENGNYIKLKKK